MYFYLFPNQNVFIFFRSYDWLRKHYYDNHYLCEEGNCVNEQFTSVFRTSIDLQGKYYYKQYLAN